MPLVNVNFATSTIANVGGIASGDTSLDVQAGDGTLFDPDGLILSSNDNYGYIVLVDSSGNREIVKYTDVSTDTITIVRAQQDTSARAFAQNDVVEARMTAGWMNEALGVSVNNSNGNPNISDTILDVVTDVTEDAWESVGPTGSGATNIWTALDSAPANTSHIRVRAIIYGVDCWVRKHGGTQSTGNDNLIGSGLGMAEMTIPVDSDLIFDVQWNDAGGSSICDLVLVECKTTAKLA